MRARVKVNQRELKKLQKRIDTTVNENVIEAWIEECLRDMAKKLVRKIKERTPVNTGLLRNSWKVGSIKKTGSIYEIEVFTEVEYAKFVEEGFKAHFVPGYWQGNQFVYDPAAKTGMQVGKPGTYVKGRFMVLLAEFDLEREKRAFLQRKQKQLLKGIIEGRG
ncbi:hypothetical protein A0U40_18265 [[Bacillus] sp. KCTC 13219]|nr:hypothetical protein A0U40_18265 [[Bacillus] sp. KCTC 13219]